MRRLVLLLGLTWAAVGAYLLAYAVVRGTHGLVHTRLWTSEEGLNGHHVHDIAGGDPLLLRAFRPLAWLEVKARDAVE